MRLIGLKLVAPVVCSLLALTALEVPAGPAAVAAPASAAAEASFPGDSVSSPDGSLRATVGVVDGRLTYEVVRDGATSVVAPSGLGFTLRLPAADLRSGMSITGTDRREIDETWTPAWGTASKIRDHAQELTVHALQESSGIRLDVVFRVFDDGVGFRYHFPDQPALGSQFVVSGESTEFALPADMTAYYIAAGTDWNADEKHYMTVPLPQVPTAQTPITTSRADGLFVTVHEADLTDFPSMTLRRDDAVPGKLTSELIALPNGDKAVVDQPAEGFDTPWRTLTIGRAAGDLAVSHLIENLNDPCAICDVDSDDDGVDDTTDWIHPATYTGVWWELQRRATTWNSGAKHGATTARTKAYIDLAAAAGAKYVLAEGWNTNAGISWTGQDFTTPQDDFDLAEVIAYGESKGVGFIAHNETRGFVDYYDQNLERIFSRYEELGIHAIKTGYATKFQLGGVNRSHYDQEAVRHYQRVIDAAAEHGISIDAHEAIKPTGLDRTYPNMMSGEGLAGMEMQNYMGANGNPPEQATILPFTRFMGGPADYTPGVLNVTWDPGALNTRVQTTLTTQLALYTTFYSPMQMLADTPENYALFPEAFDYLTDMPATWDESEVDAVIGDSTVTARRSGDTWYVGAITDEKDRTLSIPLDFLDADTTYVAEIYSDSADTTWRGNPLPMDVDRVLVTSGTDVTAALVAGGGQAMRIRPATSEQQTTLSPYAAPVPTLVGAPQVTLEPDTRTAVVEATVRNDGSTVGQAVFDVDGGSASASATARVGAGEERTVTLRLPADALPFPGTSTLTVGDGLGGTTDSADVDLLPEVDDGLAARLQDLIDAGDLDAASGADATAYLARAVNRQARSDFAGTQRAMQGLRLLADRSSTGEVSSGGGAAIDAATEPFLGEAGGVFAALRALRDLEASEEVDASTVDGLRSLLAGAATSAATGADAAARTAVGTAVNQASALSGSGPALTALRSVLAGLNQADVRLEAEAGTKANGATNSTEHAGYTGTGFVKALTKAGAAVTMSTTLGAAIDYDVSVRFANGMNIAPLDRQLTLTANDRPGVKVFFANQGQDADRWKRWAVTQAGTMPLKSGPNTLTLAWVGDDTGNVNVDNVVVRPALGVLADAAVQDLSAPTVTTTVDPVSPGEWSRQAVSVSVATSDEVDAMPETEVRVDGGAWRAYDGPVAITADGLHTLDARAIDAAGNLAAPTSATVGVDSTDPLLSFDLDDRSHAVTVDARDEVSAIRSTEFRVGDGTWQPYTAAVPLDRSAASVLEARTTDAAGNTTRATVRVPRVGDPVVVTVQSKTHITAVLEGRHRARGRDVLTVRVPTVARSAKVGLYEIRHGKRVLLGTRKAGGSGAVRFVVKDRSRSRRTYVALVGATSRTVQAWTPKRTLR